MTPIPEHPFSTQLTLKILTLIQGRDLELLNLRNDHHAGKITTDQFREALEQSEERITADIMQACVITMRNLEQVVDNVLVLQRQMQEFRNQAAAGIELPAFKV